MVIVGGNENLPRAFRELKKQNDGKLFEYRKRSHFRSKKEIRRLERSAAIKRRKTLEMVKGSPKLYHKY